MAEHGLPRLPVTVKANLKQPKKYEYEKDGYIYVKCKYKLPRERLEALNSVLYYAPFKRLPGTEETIPTARVCPNCHGLSKSLDEDLNCKNISCSVCKTWYCGNCLTFGIAAGNHTSCCNKCSIGTCGGVHECTEVGIQQFIID